MILCNNEDCNKKDTCARTRKEYFSVIAKIEKFNNNGKCHIQRRKIK
jgi:hypothetical protein